MTDTEFISLMKCLADKSRLGILRSLAAEDMYVERLARRLDLTPATVSFHLKKLSDAGLVDSYKSQYYSMYSLRREVLELRLLDIISAGGEDEELQRRDEEYRQRVLDSFFEYGKLISIPVQRKKERIVLERIAESFEAGRDYSEREVNLIIADFHDDFCTLRRDMIAEKLMERKDGIYRKK